LILYSNTNSLPEGFSNGYAFFVSFSSLVLPQTTHYNSRQEFIGIDLAFEGVLVLAAYRCA
jgi:hypothetical protein